MFRSTIIQRPHWRLSAIANKRAILIKSFWLKARFYIAAGTTNV